MRFRTDSRSKISSLVGLHGGVRSLRRTDSLLDTPLRRRGGAELHLNEQAHRLFATQHGVASVEQLEMAGYTRSQLKRLEAQGTIIRVHNGAYRSPSVPLDELARCAAVCLARPQTVIAGPTAGRLWGLRRLPRDHRIHVLAPPASHPCVAPWIRPYRTEAFHAHDIVTRADGIRVTSRARTALDLARWLQPTDLLSVVEQVMHDGRLVEADLLEVVADWISPQRPWASKFLRQLDRRLPGAAAESHPEVRVADALVGLGLSGLVRQFRIDLPGYGSARFDLAVPALRWAIEVDVHPRHEETAGRLSDEQRDVAALAVGWDTTRVERDAYEHHFARSMVELQNEYRHRRGIETTQR